MNLASMSLAIPQDRPLKPFGDLVVLINPAFEAARYFNLKSLAEMFEYPLAQRPVVAFFCAENDAATRRAFPFGRFFSTRFQRYRNDELHDEQRAANHRTVPWMDSYVTHSLEASAPTPDGNLKHLSIAPAAAMEHLERIVKQWEEIKDTDLPLANCILRPLPHKRPWNPFYVVKVKPPVLNKHGGIWNEEFSEFMASFVTISIRDHRQLTGRPPSTASEAGP